MELVFESKAIFEPSGEKSGSSWMPFHVIMDVRPVPSVLIILMWASLLSMLYVSKITFLPSGENRGRADSPECSCVRT